MSDLSNVDEILDFAIGEEQAAHDFYMNLATKLNKPGLGQIFEGFAKEELGHKAKLESVKAGKKLMESKAKVADLKIADYLIEVEASEGDLDYQQALIIAMKKEKAAFRLYSDLASKTDDAGIKTLLLGLAQEEAKHKLRFEVEYDDFVLVEN